MIFIYKKKYCRVDLTYNTTHGLCCERSYELSSMAFEIVPIRGIVQLCMVGLYADIGSK